MKLVHTISEIRDLLNTVRRNGGEIGFVPTMGALHEGHLSLVRIAREQCATSKSVVLMSIFVNPLQFNATKDLETYPRTLEEDCRLAQAAGVDIVFAPSDAELYPHGSSREAAAKRVRIHAGDRSAGLCGATRPGHFDGVVTVVGLLFNIIQPTVAVFGEKDYQQVQVIQQMVDDLRFPVRITAGPIIRDTDGLALSSRNKLLTVENRFHALYINRSLWKAQEMVAKGERNVETLRRTVIDNLEISGGLRPDYVEIVDAETLAPITEICAPAQLLVAAFAGDVRLIDNARLEFP